MNLVGLDPSFTNAGVALIDTDNKTMVLTSVGNPIGAKTFSNLARCVECQVNSIIDLLPETATIISETPPASGQFSSGLFGLDVHLLLTIKNMGYPVYGVSPVYLAHIHGTRKYHKSDSVVLAKKLIQVFENNNYSVKITGRLSNDMAEALIFNTRLFVSIYRNDISKQLLNVCKAIGDEKEFKL